MSGSLHPLRVVPAPRHRPPVLPDTEPWEEVTPASPEYVQDALAVDFTLASDDALFGEQPSHQRLALMVEQSVFDLLGAEVTGAIHESPLFC